MKKLIMTMIAALAVGSGWNAEAIGPGSLYVGAEGSYSVVSPEYYKFGLFGVNANYSIDLTSKIFVSPEVSLYYQHLPDGGEMPVWIPYPGWELNGEYSQTANTFGGGLGAYAGLRFAKPVFFFTGPLARCNFYQKVRKNYNGEITYHDIYEHRANLLWRFGLGVDVWRLRIRASYDLYVTDRGINDDEKKSGAVSVGVAFKL